MDLFSNITISKERYDYMLRLSRLLAISLTMVLLFTGCLSQGPTAGEAEDTEKSEPLKKLTTREVIAKTQKVTNEAKGLTFKTEGNQKIQLEVAGQTQGIDQKINMDVKMTNNPAAMHFSGTVEGGGQSGKLEAYQVGDEIYQQLDGTWVKGKGADLSQASGGQAEDPSKALEMLMEILSKFKGDKDTPFQMEETEDEYIITLKVTDEQKEIKELMMKQLSGALVPAMKQAGVTINETDIKLNSLEQVYHIDKKTFDQKKVDQSMELELPIQEGGISGLIKVEQSTATTMTGKFEGTIEVPQEVKDQAREISM